MSLVFHGSRIYLAHGVLGRVFSAEVKRRALRRLLIVADGASGKAAQAPLDGLKRALPDEADVVLLDVSTRGPGGDVMAGALELVALERCDAVVALGRQPVIDFAKLLIRNLAEAGTAAAPRAWPEPEAVRPCFIAIPSELEAVRALGPTTLAAGAENGGAAALFDPELIPDIAICDEDFLEPATPRLASAVGMSILSDAIEAVSARGDNPMADALALDAIRQVCIYLEQIAGGGDVPPPGALAGALVECLVAMQKGLGAAGAIGNAVAISHGGERMTDLSAVVLPTVLEFNVERGAWMPARLEQTMGLPREKIAGYVRGLARRLRLPVSLCEIGIKREELRYLADLAFLDANTSTNPSEIAVDDYAALLSASFG